MIDLSICPLFKCNLNCGFCYLGSLRERKNDLLDLNRLEDTFQKHDVRVLDLYGGEISLLEDDYARDLMRILEQHYLRIGENQIGITTNGLNWMNSPILKYLDTDDVNLSFSYDLCRQYPGKIACDIKEYDSNCKYCNMYSIISLDICDLDYEFLNSLENLYTISIKPYSPSAYNRKVFKSKMLQILQTLHDKYPQLFSKLEIADDFRDKVPHYFLMPDGNLYDIQYDNDGFEYFERIDNCKNDVDSKCLSCKFFGKCFNEHYSTYNPSNGLSDDCLGRKKAMEYLEWTRKAN